MHQINTTTALNPRLIRVLRWRSAQLRSTQEQRRRMSATGPLLTCLAAISCAASQSETCDGSALSRARALQAPAVSKVANGEFEGSDFWEANDALLRRAWLEYGKRHKALYSLDDSFEQLYISPKLRAACSAIRSGHAKNESAVEALFGEAVPGVFATTEIFTPLFR